MKNATGIFVIGVGCALGLSLISAALAQSGPPNQAQMIEALRPVPSALQGGHQGLPIGGSAPVIPSSRQITRASTGSSEPAAPVAHPHVSAPTAPAAVAATNASGCDASGDAGKPALSLKWITFEFGSAVLRPEAIGTLQTLGKTLTENYPDATFLIQGHTDATGTFDYNQGLSLQRAQAVKDYLSQQMGVKPERLEVAGLGYCDLANPGDPRAAENRRVVIVNKAS
jgi:outer membrane protein OmpA-like peptidoglycan-associated protein